MMGYGNKWSETMTTEQHPNHQSGTPLTMGDLAPFINLASEYVRDQRKDQKARRFRTYVLVVLILVVTVGAVMDVIKTHVGDLTAGSYAAVVPIDGPIVPDGMMSAKRVITMVKKAFEDKDAKAVILDINSPGGTPTQSYMIYQYIMDMKEKTGKPVIASAGDAMTSGAYMVAMAADEIYAPPMAMVGSIGVKMESFGYSGLMEKFDVERRVVTSGPNKSRFDPFLPQSEADVIKAKEMISQLQNQFVDLVMEHRGPFIQDSDQDALFSGDYWVAEKAVELGLIDGLLTLTQVVAHLGLDDIKLIAPEVTLSDILGRK